MGLPTEFPDRHRFERELGQGGMATVSLTGDLKHDRQVAMKVLRPERAANRIHRASCVGLAKPSVSLHLQSR